MSSKKFWSNAVRNSGQILYLLGFFIFVLCAAATTEADEEKWITAEQNIVRLLVEEFPSLPSDHKRFLREMGCTIPQPGDTESERTNVIVGEFAKRGQKDWAVLCSPNGISSIVVLWGGAATCPSEINSVPDRNYLQVIGRDFLGFSREIAPMTPKAISDRYKAWRYGHPPNVDHDSIDDIFVNKGSVTYYCTNGSWMVLGGSD
ncbi:MAG: hypothetical protein ACE5MK_11070 [Acidobacteriota bacterium]